MKRTLTKLRAWRTAQGYSLRDMEGLTGYSEAMFSLVERGLRDLSPRAKVLVARRLGVDVNDLFDVEPMGER